MKLFISLLFLLLTQLTFAQDAVIAVGTAEQDLDKLVIDDPEIQSTDGDHKRVALEITDILRNNFVFYKHKFNVVNYEEKGKKSFSEPKVEEWKSNGVTYFISSSFKFNTKTIQASYRVWSILTSKEILNQTFKVDSNNLRPAVHSIADTIYRKITGKPSIFKSKIVFISDRTSEGRDIIKELYVMDFDGRRVEKLTNFNSVVLSPSISSDNSRILFSLIATHKSFSGGKTRSIKNIDLKMLDLNSGKFSTISQKPGINSGAIFSGTGDRIYLTLSFSGNADIYEMGLDGGRMKKLTSHYSDDVDPSITQDGSLMSFLSNRPGRAHIYTMDPTGIEKDVKRISFVGQFNATPRFSPDGKEIVFTSWVDNGFDLYRIGSDGNNLARLTKDFGSNEEPVYSPDGEFIVFTSNKLISRSKATQDLYIMNRDGEILGQLTQGFGKCLSPQWTNLPK
jgi:TolB protein